MQELSLYILDIVMNSVRAGASNIDILLDENEEQFIFSVKDDGCGMTKEQLSKLKDPFFTTRKTRKVGLGIPFIRMLAEQTGGTLKIDSRCEIECGEHGTELVCIFNKNHIDFIPLGDIISTLITLIQGSPDIDFKFIHNLDGKSIELDISEIRKIIGPDIPLSSPEILRWIREYLSEQYNK